VCGYALVSANLVPSYGLNSSTVLWMERETLIIKPPLPCGIPIYGKGFGRKPRG